MLTAILGGLGAAAAWTVSTVCSSRSSRMIEPAAVVGWVMLVGFVVAVPVALAGGVPRGLHGSSLLWLALAGAGNVGGLLLAYAAMRVGQVAVVAPVVSTEGAMAALIAILAGESIAPRVAVTLMVIVLGIALASIPARSGEQRPTDRRHVRTIVLALAAAVAFGASLYAAGRAGAALPSAWVAAAARMVGVPLLAIPLLLARRLRLTRPVVPLVVSSGVCEVLGFYAYTAGARHGIAVAAVLSSQFGSFAALAGFGLFGERLTRSQLLGVVATVAGVAVLSALQA
jgi:drug/metabolite transporter (DMT)-like permease